ncbi:transmembrane protein 116 [Synchiropus splendidus]|uniref:transmembrane protein 116 n=1 Tax=Synchiropus splendidus TaxID=270530 RepID=UPI00237DE748|nr:transmembrane protein 116 [Synchiropus splendidus]
MLNHTTDDWSQEYEAVRWVQLLMVLLSFLGSFSIIVCVMSQRLSRSPELQPLLLLSVSDLLLSFCWLLGGLLLTIRCSSYNTHCQQLHTLEQVLYTSCFFFTLNCVWNIYRGIHRRLDCSTLTAPATSGRPETVTALLSCLLPVVMMSPVISMDYAHQCLTNLTEPYRCGLLHTGAVFLAAEHSGHTVCNQLLQYRLIVLLTAFFVTLLGIMVLMGRTRHIYRRVLTSNGFLGNRQRASLRVLNLRMILYPTIFFLCWGPAVALAFLREVEPPAGQSRVRQILYMWQAVAASSQGFLNCLVYGWTHARLRRVGRMVLSRDADTQTPLLRAQKTRTGYGTASLTS